MAQLDAFQVIADPGRRHILHMLSKDSMTINDIAAQFDISRPAVSKHIKILNAAGFITIQDVGRERYCMLQQEGFKELNEWIAYYDNFWAGKLKKLDTLLNTKNKKK